MNEARRRTGWRWVRRGRLALAGILALSLATASLAAAAEVSRETYKAEVEPICQANTKANEKILKGVRAEVKQGKLKPAGAAFAKAGAALAKAYGELRVVPEPSADEARLAKWLADIEREASLFGQGAKALKAGKKSKAQTIVAKLEQTARFANDEVLPFDFHYCKLEPSKFT